MSKVICISNNELTINISTLGAEMKSVKKDGKELLWQGDPSVWSGQAPLLFPICGGLKDNKYIYEGKEYTLPKHGFGRLSEFELESNSENEAVFLLRSSEETLKSYPFDFELRVKYTIEGSKLFVEYKVKNTSDKTMLFSIGSHEAYDCPEGIEEYSVIFQYPENLKSHTLSPAGQISYNTVSLGENIQELPLKYEYFAIDALIFSDIKSRKATLKNNRTGDSIEVSFPGKDYFLIWTKPTGKYICLEPWAGMGDFEDTDNMLVNKKGIQSLPANEVYTIAHTISF